MTDDPIVRMCRRFKRRWAREALAALTYAEMDEIKANVGAFLRTQEGAQPGDGAETPSEGSSRAGGGSGGLGGQE